MPKWADYLISGVWFKKFNNSQYISDVMVHEDLGDSVALGHKHSKNEVIRLLKADKIVFTIKWNYKTAKWSVGARVDWETIEGVNYLRTDPDALVTDNLDNLIDMGCFDFAD